MANNKYSHIRLPKPTEVMRFASTGMGSPVKIPLRDRQAHGEYLRKKLESAWQEAESEFVVSSVERQGVYLEFRSAPGFELVIKSLENIPKGIRLCNVSKKEEIIRNPDTAIDEKKDLIYATVYIPNEGKQFFFQRVEKYLNEETDKGSPKNQSLIDGIDDLRKALLIESFWQDDKNLIPSDDAQWCEIWLRGDSDEIVERFEKLLNSQNINSQPGHLRFPERIVKLVHVARNQLENITRLSDDIAEYRKGKNTADFFINLPPREQVEWIRNFTDRIEVDRKSLVSVCILDKGVNCGHPLLSPILQPMDCQSINRDWGSHDHDLHGHGTSMAGLAAYGDLQGKLESTEKVLMTHHLESVKILPIKGQNDPKLWGDLTGQGISLAEIQAPDRKRIVCMAITAPDTYDRGRPTSWSGALDQITSGVNNEPKRLVILAAGNFTDGNQIVNYPDYQITDSIQDPAQSWNALTVGAYTQLTQLTDLELLAYKPIAEVNQLSPFSTTSLTWEDKWPIKPEVVFEGGNAAVDSEGRMTECDDLSLLSIHHEPQKKFLKSFSMTSAAAAQAAYFAARIQSAYPNYWPETVRALIVHSAEWTQELKKQFTSGCGKTEFKQVLRACGYGVPDLSRALYCAANSLTLIAEAEIQPFELHDSSCRTKDMHFYELPWPVEVLSELGETEVEMRITLSYFIEPGPGEVGWKDRYRYASHALRFDLNSPEETKDEFVKRINMAVSNGEKPSTSSPSDHWVIGSKVRDKGSIHSDIWKGTAADLATSNLIAISPRIGWWKERKHLNKYDTKTRYALVISIKTLEQDVDIYTSVAVKVGVPISIVT